MNATPLHRHRLRRLRLPRPEPDDDKEARGRVLVVGGAREVPGSILLAGTAALRAGAGKLQLATCAGIALPLGVALPEARVFSFPETEGGDLHPDAAEEIARRAGRAAALLIGPGMVDPAAAIPLARSVLRSLEGPAVVLDAGALPLLGEDPEALHRLDGRAVVTPHAGEMARMTGREREEIEADPLTAAREAARNLRAVVVLKGSRTYVATPEGAAFRYGMGRVGLATSGSGDTLSGIVAGLLAQGAAPAAAAAWAVYLHGEAGNVLARRSGRVGFLARELLEEIPRLLERLRG